MVGNPLKPCRARKLRRWTGNEALEAVALATAARAADAARFCMVVRV